MLKSNDNVVEMLQKNLFKLLPMTSFELED